LKDRVRRAPPIAGDEHLSLCLHPAHTYAVDLSPCEQRGIDRIEETSAVLRALLDEVSYVSKGPAHRAALEWLEQNRGQ
jgi:hypothetical protein